MMSFKSREKKRQAKLAVAASRRDHRETMAGRHYLTVVSRHACCNDCGGALREGADCVYRHSPGEMLCVQCADSRKIYYRPSLRWEKKHRKQTQAGRWTTTWTRS